MDIAALADRCMKEIDNFRRGAPTNDEYGLELFRLALKERDPFAWETIEKIFKDMMLMWMRKASFEESCMLLQ